MEDLQTTLLLEYLQSFAKQSNEPLSSETVQRLIEWVKVGNITHSTGIAIGRDIQMVVNQFDLPAEAVTGLMEKLAQFGPGTTRGPIASGRYPLQEWVVEKSAGFVGREHVFSAIVGFVQRYSSGYFIIEGDPGIGKSAILAEYVRRTGCLIHFNTRTLGIHSLAQFLENICAQLIARYDLPYSEFPLGALQDGGFLHKLLYEASNRLAPDEKLIIAVDALDEVEVESAPAGANVLYLPSTLPDKVYFVVTQRRVSQPLNIQSARLLLDLTQYTTENSADAESYIRQTAKRAKLRTWIEQKKIPLETLIATLIAKSECNFMYLRHVLTDLGEGRYPELTIEQLPQGLEGYYESHWHRMGMTTRPVPRIKLRIVYVLSEVAEPVSRQLLSQLTSDAKLGVDEITVQEVLDEWGQFLHSWNAPDGKRYSVYHSSFRDFLHQKDITQAAGIDLKDIHALIANSLWRDLIDDEPGL